MSIKKTMEVKEAIEWIKTKAFCLDTMGDEKKLRDFECNQDSIISLLQQGEALKAENKELEAYRHIVSELKWKPSVLTHGMLPLWLRELEQKYFPKDVSQNYKESEE